MIETKVQKAERAEPAAPLAKPWNEDPFLALHNRMDRWFSDLFHDFGRPLALGPGAEFTPAAWTAWPKVDLTVDEKCVRVVADVPGNSDKDLQVTIDEGRLVIAGEKRTEKEEKGKDWFRRERSFGSFRRAIDLPVEVASDRAEAKFANGVLTVEIPRIVDERSKPRSIPVKNG
jgi:HSP20 family protein